MNLPNDRRFRVTIRKPKMADGSYKKPGKVCVLRRAMPKNPSANAQWDTWRDFWLNKWSGNKVLAETFMFWTTKKNGMVRMEVDNYDSLVTEPTQAYLDLLSAPLIAWKIKIQTLSHEEPITLIIRRTERMPIEIQNNNVINEKSKSFQHVGQIIGILACGGIQIINPEVIKTLLSENEMLDCNTKSKPYVANADIPARRQDEKNPT